MDPTLDLCVTLMQPPHGSPPSVLAAILLQCEQLGLSSSGDLLFDAAIDWKSEQNKEFGLSSSGDLLFDPLPADDRENLRWYLEEYWKWPYEHFLERGKQIEARLPKIGRQLYNAVFGSTSAQIILQAWRLQPLSPEDQRQISIVSDIPAVLSLPWELLHDEQGFLALRTRNPVAIVRRFPQDELSRLSTPLKPPLRILLVTPRPDNAAFIDPRSTARELLDAIQPQIEAGKVAVELLRPATLQALRSRLAETRHSPVHVLHFDGHGTFGLDMQEPDEVRLHQGVGMLAFEDENGMLDLVGADALGQLLQGSSVRLAVLTASQSAMSAADDAYSSVAAQLIRGGVDAVVAMGTSVLVATATRYADTFYRNLTDGASVAVAHERAQQALAHGRRLLFRRRADEEGVAVKLFDWWVPHFYQQRPLVLQTAPSAPPTRKRRKSTNAPTLPRLDATLPAGPRYGYVGRSRELLQVERLLSRKKLVIVHGFGGVGKTSFVCEVADWLTRTQMYTSACFVSFEYGGDAASLLSGLGNSLGVNDSMYNPPDSQAPLARLKPVLQEQLTLLIADNVDGILPGGEAPLSPEARTHLWDVLLELARMNVGILVTNRDSNLADGRFAAGQHVAHLALEGLHPEDAYLLAMRLLTDLGIERTRAPYAELRALLAQLDHHPLAIQLVLPALRSFSLSTIRSDFAALLPTFTDERVVGRNSSLLASLDYSLRQLSDEQRAWLPRLACFEGGAIEGALLRITEIPETTWTSLRQALEQADLITVERIPEELDVPFLRFHPILIPYLHNLVGTDDRDLRVRYAQVYFQLVTYPYREEQRQSQPVQTIIRRELPNLRRALTILMQEGAKEAATNMADALGWFLDALGMVREREEMRQRIAQASKTSGAKDGRLTSTEYLLESRTGTDELNKGDVRAAYARFSALLARIEALPEGAPLGKGSYQHCLTIAYIARCLRDSGQLEAAESRLREALEVIGKLLEKQPDAPNLLNVREVLLTNMGDTLLRQEKYTQAYETYQEALQLAVQRGDGRQQATNTVQLGLVARYQKNYDQARDRFSQALKLYRTVGDLSGEAVTFYYLGHVELAQARLDRAEQWYRESLKITEQIGDIRTTALNCNQLATVANAKKRPAEAKEWYRRAIALIEQSDPDSPTHALLLNNLVRLLVAELQDLLTRAGDVREVTSYLSEARTYAERVLAINEKIDAPAPSDIKAILEIIASIEEMVGRTEDADVYSQHDFVDAVPERNEQTASTPLIETEVGGYTDSPLQPILEQYNREQRTDISSSESVLHYENPEKVAHALHCWQKSAEAVQAPGNSVPAALLEEVVELLLSSLHAQWVTHCKDASFFGVLLNIEAVFPTIPKLHHLPLVLYTGPQFCGQDTDALRTFIRQLDAEARRALVIFFVERGQPTEPFKDALKALRVYAYDTVPIFYDEFEKVIDAKDPRQAFRKLILANTDLSMISPFVLAGPTSESMFFGRERELQMITENIGVMNYALIGGRRIGKTSILKRLQRDRLPKNGFYALYHDCSYTPTETELIQAVSRNKEWFPTEPVQPFETFAQVLQALPDDKPLVLLLDEADKLIASERSPGNRTYRIFNTLRAQATAGRCRIVFSGEYAFRSELLNSGSPLYNFVNELRIGRLGLEDVRELIVRPIRDLEIELVDENTMVRRIWSFTAGHPNVVQRFCHRLITRINTRQIFRLTMKDVEAVMTDPDFLSEDFLGTYWERATTLERLCTLLMARSRENKSFTLKALHSALTRRGLKVTLNQVRTAVERLVGLRTILERVSATEYRFAVLSFPQALAEQRESLLELDSENYTLYGDVELSGNGG